MQTALGGTTATTVFEYDRHFGVVVRSAPEFRDTIELSATPRSTSRADGNAYIPLSEVADISSRPGLPVSFTKDLRFIPIKFSVRGRDLGGAVAEGQEEDRQGVNCRTAIGWIGPASSGT